VPVDDLDMPAVGGESHGLIVRDGERGRAVDGDAIVVEQHDQAAQPEVSGKRGGFVADSFHEAAVAGDDVGPVIHHGIAEAGIHHALGQRQADRVAEALAQGAGRGFYAARRVVFRVARGPAAQLPKVAELLQGHGWVAGEVKQGVKQHGAVPGRQDEAVAVRPVGAGGVESEKALKQYGRDIGHAHRHAGMTGLGLFHRIHGEEADRVGHFRMADFTVFRRLRDGAGSSLRPCTPLRMGRKMLPGARRINHDMACLWR
jgi:hypothetical protein